MAITTTRPIAFAEYQKYPLRAPEPPAAYASDGQIPLSFGDPIAVDDNLA